MSGMGSSSLAYLPAPPLNPYMGQEWFNTTLNVVQYFDGVMVRTYASTDYIDERPPFGLINEYDCGLLPLEEPFHGIELGEISTCDRARFDLGEIHDCDD